MNQQAIERAAQEIYEERFPYEIFQPSTRKAAIAAIIRKHLAEDKYGT